MVLYIIPAVFFVICLLIFVIRMVGAKKEQYEILAAARKKKAIIRLIIAVIITVLLSISMPFLVNILHDKLLQTIDVKPIIYLYPEEECEVEVSVGYPEKLTVTYPLYDNGWRVHASPDGTLTDGSGREYYALYWEGKDDKLTMQSDGFCVRGEDSAAFLEEKLAILGLNEREAEEFIVYWLPKLQKNPYNYIHFETTEEINESMPLNITPAPDCVIRVMMDYIPLQKPVELEEQQLTSPLREGYVAVEWGGRLIAE